MIRIRTAAALAAGTIAALTIGGVALASDGADDNRVLSPTTTASPDATVTSDATASPDATVSSDATASPEATSTSPGQPGSTSGSTSGSASGSKSGSTFRISLDEAQSIALHATDGGHIESTEAETEHGRPVWDIDIVTNGIKHDLDIDRTTGQILRHRADDKPTRSSGNSSRHSSGRDDSRHSSGRDGSRHSSGRDDSRHHGNDGSTDDHGRHGSNHS
jgi:uncharacterized membrane protein YkoI